MAQEYIGCGDVANTDNINDFSVAFWINFGTLTTEQYLVTKGAYNVSGDCWAVKMNSRQLQFSVSNSITAVHTGLKLRTDKWYHIAITYSNTSDAIAFYIDGAATDASGFTISGSYITIPANTGRDVRIGTGYNGSNVSGLYFKGKMFEVGVWNAALSASEITAIYNSGRTIDLSSASGNYAKQGNLVGYWKLDEGDGTSFADSSTATNTGSGVNITASNHVKGNTFSVLNATKDTIDLYKPLTLNSISAIGSDTDTFLMLDGSTVKTATGANVTSYLTEEIQDIVGAMFTSNTETRISATYEDSDGTIDLVVTDMTNVSGDSGNAAIYDNSGTPALKSGITRAEVQSLLNYVASDADDTMAGTLTIDKNNTATTTSSTYGLKIDYDSTGNTGASQVVTNYGLDVDLDYTGTNASGGTTNNFGINIALNSEAGAHSSASGIDNIAIKAVLTGDTETADTTQVGYDLTITGGDVGSQTGLLVNTDDGSTDLKIVSSADTGDYFSIATTTHGATTITTVDDDAAAAHLTLDADGDINLDAVGATLSGINLKSEGTTFGFFTEHHSASWFTLYEQGGASTADYLEIKVEEHGATTITTKDNNAEAASLTVDVDGDIVLDSATGNILLKDNGGNYTPGSDYEAATKKYVDDNAGGGSSKETFSFMKRFTCNSVGKWVGGYRDNYYKSSEVWSLSTTKSLGGNYTDTTVSRWASFVYSDFTVANACTITKFTCSGYQNNADEDIVVGLWKVTPAADTNHSGTWACAHIGWILFEANADTSTMHATQTLTSFQGTTSLSAGDSIMICGTDPGTGGTDGTYWWLNGAIEVTYD